MMTIGREKTYRHQNCLDVDMYVVRVLWFTEDYFKLDVIWVNRKNPEILNPDRVVLHRKDLGNWEELSDTKGAGVAQR